MKNASAGNKRILAVDPGTTQSGFYVDKDTHGTVANDVLLYRILDHVDEFDAFAIEMMEARGMPLGNESLETVLWTGRLVQAAWHVLGSDEPIHLVRRSTVKLTLCGTTRAKDANVRAALIDIYGKPGTKKQPGGTYGVRAHAWAALGVWHVAREGA